MSCWTVFGRLVAYEMLRTNTPLDGLDAALNWDGRNPDIYYIRALMMRDDPGLADLELVESDLATSIRFNPYNSRYWQALAQYREVTGKKQEASQAYRRAVELNPQSGYHQWQWANFLLRNGHQDEAFAVMKGALRLRPELRTAAVRMLLNMQATASQVLDMWPDDYEGSLQLLRYYIQLFPRSEAIWGKDLGNRLWDNVLKNPEPIDPEQAAFYLQFLFNSHMYQQLRDAWAAVWRGQGQDVEAFAAGKNYCWNGDFESELNTKPLGWQLSDAPGFRVNVDRPDGDPDSNSMKIYFDGTENIEFRHVSQTVIVDPGREYRLVFRARSEDLKPHQGIFVEISDGQKVLAATEPMLGTHPWQQYSAFLSAGSDTELIRITVRRRRSHRIDSLIEGTVWFDDFQLLPSASSQ